MTKLNDWSDRDLNRGIARKLGYLAKNQDEVRIRLNGLHTVDYCNNWNDLYPLILKYKIERHLNDDGTHLFDSYVDDADCFTVIKGETNQVQRGYCECLYLVLQEKKKEKHCE